MSTAQFTCPLIVVIPGQLITASLWNGEFTNLYSNINPQGVGAYADTDSQFQAQSDPFPGSVTSRPSALSGEVERLRFAIAGITGETYWYNVPDDTIGNLNTRVTTLEALLPSGTKIVFYQAAPPAGWTQVTTDNDKALRIVSGTGGGSGGVSNMSTGLAHTHNVNAHTHDMGNHTHTMGNHTHSTPTHVHTLTNSSVGAQAGGTPTTTPVNVTSAGGAMNATTWGGGGSHTLNQVSATTNGSEGGGTTGTPSTNTSDTPSTNTTGSASPVTDSSTPTFKYIDVIVASKD